MDPCRPLKRPNKGLVTDAWVLCAHPRAAQPQGVRRAGVPTEAPAIGGEVVARLGLSSVDWRLIAKSVRRLTRARGRMRRAVSGAHC